MKKERILHAGPRIAARNSIDMELVDAAFPRLYNVPVRSPPPTCENRLGQFASPPFFVRPAAVLHCCRQSICHHQLLIVQFAYDHNEYTLFHRPASYPIRDPRFTESNRSGMAELDEEAAPTSESCPLHIRLIIPA